MEKYRPQVLDDVVGNTETIERLKVIAKDGNCPHIIISVSAFAGLTLRVDASDEGVGDARYRKDDEHTLFGSSVVGGRV